MSTTALSTAIADSAELKARIDRFQGAHRDIVREVRKVIVGQEEVVEQVLVSLFVGGHCLITGLPGTAKTLLVRTLAQTLGLVFKRIQFTPDLMPSDITGTDIIEEDTTTGHRSWTFVPGPIFSNILLADEINRTPPKTQSALLEAMQERQLTICGQTYKLPDPFFVLATQNPVETEGTYPLPEAQLDRFLLKIRVGYPSREEELEIARRQTTDYRFTTRKVLSAHELQLMQTLVRSVVVSDHVYNAAIDFVRATRPEENALPAELRNMVQWGAGPRATIALLMAAKARAILNRRCHATTGDLKAVALPVLRHRIILTFNAEAAGVDADAVLSRIVGQTPSMQKEQA